MEASGGAVPGMERVLTRIEELDRRATANHDSIASVRGAVASLSTDAKVLHTEFEAQREDMGELKDQMRWVIRGLVAATVTFTGLVVTILAAVTGGG